ncbi:hypothetical protein IE077_003798 [Cardiosporidium cionae]|uniref:Alpha-ketoglutarate-dependent dioxygenase AlkB-like domain-containing protein n=1 Tax=Cardiosporidium cionae TaxID=476202 RepID=A0ABQ7JEI6_9APIC|nr:hypothetical protein IE077_003798 [Cardiosporidium cionae]|eukprot:KAF8822414.1 hypothetical protein IE077_003798 [Cardiosporidium cionae]
MDGEKCVSGYDASGSHVDAYKVVETCIRQLSVDQLSKIQLNYCLMHSRLTLLPLRDSLGALQLLPAQYFPTVSISPSDSHCSQACHCTRFTLIGLQPPIPGQVLLFDQPYHGSPSCSSAAALSKYPYKRKEKRKKVTLPTAAEKLPFVEMSVGHQKEKVLKICSVDAYSNTDSLRTPHAQKIPKLSSDHSPTSFISSAPPSFSLSSPPSHFTDTALTNRLLSDAEDASLIRIVPLLKLKTHEGAYLLPGYLSLDEQVSLVAECLSVYIEKPFITNLDIKNDPSVHSLWQILFLCVAAHPFFKQLRWSSLGYSYDWSNRSYSDGALLPDALKCLSRQIAAHVGFPSFLPQAALLNLYRCSERLRGHQDNVEDTSLDSPLVSISLGAPCVFLLGFQSRQEPPLPLILRSGDVLLLSKDSRLSYHGIPKLLYSPISSSSSSTAIEMPPFEGAFPPCATSWLSLETVMEKQSSISLSKTMQWKSTLQSSDEIFSNEKSIQKASYENFMKTHRINLSIRQVYANDDHSSLT